MTRNVRLLSQVFSPKTVKKVVVADTNVVDVVGEGTMNGIGHDGTRLSLSNVLYVPALGANALSDGQLEEGGACLVRQYGCAWVLDPTGRVIMTGVCVGRLYRMNITPVVPAPPSPAHVPRRHACHVVHPVMYLFVSAATTVLPPKAHNVSARAHSAVRPVAAQFVISHPSPVQRHKGQSCHVYAPACPPVTSVVSPVTVAPGILAVSL